MQDLHLLHLKLSKLRISGAKAVGSEDLHVVYEKKECGRTENAHWKWKVRLSSSTTPLVSVLSQYALSSTSASSNASFPRLVGRRLSKPALSLSVARDPEAFKIRDRNSSSRTLIAWRASGLSFIGRMSERMTSAE